MDWVQRTKALVDATAGASDRLLLAVSGGADSMGMLAALLEAGVDPGRIAVGHVRHGMRSSEKGDLDPIRQWCALHKIPVLIRECDTPAVAKAERLSLEMAARQLRYGALSGMAAAAGCTWILTGHTLDDCAETVWMRMANGAPWYEWTGIPLRRGKILRPVLHARRSDLRRLLVDRGILFTDDETNTDRRFVRNRIRMEMQARQSLWNDQRKQELAQAGETVEKLLVFQKRLARALPGVFLPPPGTHAIGLAIDAIFIYFKSLKFVPVEAAWGDLGGYPEGRLPSGVRRQVEQFIAGSTPAAEMLLPGRVRLIRRGGALWLSSLAAPATDEPVRADVTVFPSLKRKLELSTDGSKTGITLAPEICDRPLRVRSWRPGDRLKTVGRPRKKVSDLLNEAGLDPIARERTVLLVDEVGPLMILGGPVDERALAGTHNTNTLKVTWTKYERDDDEAAENSA